MNPSISRCSLTILIVEDNPQLRKLETESLRAAGYEVLEARDAKQALELSRQHGDKLALLIADLLLPEIPGSTLVKKFREERPSVPILLVSGESEAFLRALAVQERTTYLRKPFRLAVLVEKVKALLADGV